MRTPQPTAALHLCHAKPGDTIIVDGQPFRLRSVDPWSDVIDPVYLDDMSMLGNQSNVLDANVFTRFPYDQLFRHVRDDATGNAVMERTRLIEILDTGEYTIQ